MKELKLWWKKGWMKNLLFLGILGVLFFTDAGEWLRIQFTSLTLSVPENEVNTSELPNSIHQFPLQLKAENGDEFLLREHSGKPIFINFWASWCVPCLAEFSLLVEFKSNFPDVEFMFITAEDQVAFDTFLAIKSNSLPYYRQLSRIPDELSHGAIPATFLINEKGEVLYQHIGAADWDDQATIDEVRELLK
jgi:thiol-disulfide isomerase/thioredoxin